MRKNIRTFFTLTELLVVIAIIAVLAGLIMPALMNAQQEARLTACLNNLRQFGIEIESYRGDYDSEYPFWLSSTSLKDSPGIFICPIDESEGEEGSRPDWINSGEQYAETNDMPYSEYTSYDKSSYSNSRTTDGYIYINSNTAAENKKSSYLYEFNREKASWFSSGLGLTDPTWIEVKMAESKLPAYRSFIPVVRCFYHMEAQSGGNILADEDQPRKNVPALRYDGRTDMSYAKEWFKD
jgi:prepilin-type N-terminal cleavage/methylation domain-containing protein